MAHHHRRPITAARNAFLFVFTLGLLLSAQPAAAIVFSDADFNPADWVAQAFLTETSTAAASTQLSGGNPDDHRKIDLYSSSGFQQPTGKSMLVELKISAVVSPVALGGITVVDYQEDHRCTCVGGGVLWGPALEQGGLYYIVPGNSMPNSFTLPWTVEALTGLTATDFEEVVISSPTLTNAASHPDFSATGLPITFGYVRAKAFLATTSSFLDNWSVSINETAVGAETRPWGVVKALYR